MKQFEVYAKVKLPMGGEATVIEGNGLHLFTALIKAKGCPGTMMKFLIMELVLISGKNITEESIDIMHIRDVNYLLSCVDSMMSNKFIQGF